MIEVEELLEKEILGLLESVNYGHMACCLDDSPYVVPVHFAFDGENVFIFTTEGRKVEIISRNPKVCLQLENVIDDLNWCSVIVEGTAEALEPSPIRDRALKLITEENPTLTPAVSIHWMDGWVRENIEVIYLLRPTTKSGRRTVRSQA